jgi:hypothetical protein
MLWSECAFRLYPRQSRRVIRLFFHLNSTHPNRSFPGKSLPSPCHPDRSSAGAQWRDLQFSPSNRSSGRAPSDPLFIPTEESWASGPNHVMKTAPVQQLLSPDAPPFPLSSRPKRSRGTCNLNAATKQSRRDGTKANLSTPLKRLQFIQRARPVRFQ